MSKRITYISPSQYMMYRRNAIEYFVNYPAAELIGITRIAQNLPMGIGSAFDAMIKNELYTKCVKQKTPEGDKKYNLDELIKSQVSEEIRKESVEIAKHCMDVYKRSGAWGELLMILMGSISDPKMEIEVVGSILSRDLGFPALGKPDLYFIHKSGHGIVLDFKVNGLASTRTKSPLKQYYRLYDKDGQIKIHKDYYPKMEPIEHNITSNFEELAEDWAIQLMFYAWLCGQEVGSEFYCGIEQICGPVTDIRVAKHRGRVSQEFQMSVFKDCCSLWSKINSFYDTGLFFTEMGYDIGMAEQDRLISGDYKMFLTPYKGS